MCPAYVENSPEVGRKFPGKSSAIGAYGEASVDRDWGVGPSGHVGSGQIGRRAPGSM